MTPSRYFIGQKVDSNILEASPAQDFREFVQLHLFPAVSLNYTRDEFWGLSDDERDRAKRVAYAIPGVTSPPVRRLEHCQACNLIFIDIDDSADAQPFVAEPEMLRSHLEGYAFAAYHTARSQPTAPRIRIVVPATAIPVALYPAAVNTIAARLGLPSVTPESIRPVQPMFFPIVFKGESGEPVFAHCFDGAEFQPSDISGHEVPTTPSTRTSPATAPGEPSADDLLFLRAPLHEFTMEQAAEALNHLDPDEDYNSWVEVACALKHQFGEEGFAVFDDWSAKGPKYGGIDKTRPKWDSFKAHPTRRNPVTIRTLIAKALERGWRGGEAVQQSCRDQVEAWALHATEAELHREGALRIASVPNLTNAQEGSLISVILKRLAVFEVKVNQADLRRDVAEAHKRLAPKQSTKEDDWPKELQGLSYVSQPNKFYNHRTGERYGREQFDNTFGRFMAKNDAGLPAILPSQFLLHKLECKTPYDFVYDPTRTGSAYVTDENGRLFINLYMQRGFPTADPKHKSYVEDVFFEHLLNLFKEAEVRQMVLDFMALQVQQPGRKVRFALSIQGVQGGGKGFLADVLRTVLGPENVRLVSLDGITSKYNDWATRAQIVVIDDAQVKGHNRHEVMNKLKPLITNDFVAVDQKWENSRVERNFTNYIVLNNPHDALAINESERRYYVIESRLQTEEQVLALGDDYFDRLFGLLKHPYSAALRHFFENWPISPTFNPDGRAPKTTYFHNLVRECANDETALLRSTIEDSNNALVQPDLVGVESLRTMLAVEGINLTKHRLGKLLRDESFVRVEQKIQVEKERQIFYRKAGHLNGTTDIAAVVRERKEKEKAGVEV